MKKNLKTVISCVILVLSQHAWSQLRSNLPQSFVSVRDSNEFKVVVPKKDGLLRTYLSGFHPDILFIDSASSSFRLLGTDAIVCIEGQMKNNKREGIFSTYVIDDNNHSKRYKIAEQDYCNDKLDGQWRTYSLEGVMARYETFKEDKPNGLARMFSIDGKKVMDEKEFFGDSTHFIQRVFYDNGKLKEEVPVVNGKIIGLGKRYYEDGTIKEEAVFKDAKFDGTRKYYYPNGQVWIEEIYKEGKHWTVMANYTEKGEKRNPGTLKNGNGTLILYNEDGTVRETITYQNDEAVK